MVDMINENLPQVKGNIVCIEKGMQLTHNIPTSVRLIDVDEFKIKGCKRFYGFFAGVCASNYDIEQIYVDGILKVLNTIWKTLQTLSKKSNHLLKTNLLYLQFLQKKTNFQKNSKNTFNQSYIFC